MPTKPCREAWGHCKDRRRSPSSSVMDQGSGRPSSSDSASGCTRGHETSAGPGRPCRPRRRPSAGGLGHHVTDCTCTWLPRLSPEPPSAPACQTAQPARRAVPASASGRRSRRTDTSGAGGQADDVDGATGVTGDCDMAAGPGLVQPCGAHSESRPASRAAFHPAGTLADERAEERAEGLAEGREERRADGRADGCADGWMSPPPASGTVAPSVGKWHRGMKTGDMACAEESGAEMAWAGAGARRTRLNGHPGALPWTGA